MFIECKLDFADKAIQMKLLQPQYSVENMTSEGIAFIVVSLHVALSPFIKQPVQTVTGVGKPTIKLLYYDR